MWLYHRVTLEWRYYSLALGGVYHRVTLDKCCKTFKTLSLTQVCFPTKVAGVRLCQHFREGNCVTDISNGTFKCKLFVDKCCKNSSLRQACFPTNVASFRICQHFKRNCVANILTIFSNLTWPPPALCGVRWLFLRKVLIEQLDYYQKYFTHKDFILGVYYRWLWIGSSDFWKYFGSNMWGYGGRSPPGKCLQFWQSYR